MGDAVRLIVSRACAWPAPGEWARFSSAVFGAKAHVIYDPDLGRPAYHAVTAANVNDMDRRQADADRPRGHYVFDLGYYDFSCGGRVLDRAGCRLVTRFKTNTPLQLTPDPCLWLRHRAF